MFRGPAKYYACIINEDWEMYIKYFLMFFTTILCDRAELRIFLSARYIAPKLISYDNNPTQNLL